MNCSATRYLLWEGLSEKRVDRERERVDTAGIGRAITLALSQQQRRSFSVFSLTQLPSTLDRTPPRPFPLTAPFCSHPSPPVPSPELRGSRGSPPPPSLPLALLVWTQHRCRHRRRHRLRYRVLSSIYVCSSPLPAPTKRHTEGSLARSLIRFSVGQTASLSSPLFLSLAFFLP